MMAPNGGTLKPPGVVHDVPRQSASTRVPAQRRHAIFGVGEKCMFLTMPLISWNSKRRFGVKALPSAASVKANEPNSSASFGKHRHRSEREFRRGMRRL